MKGIRHLYQQLLKLTGFLILSSAFLFTQDFTVSWYEGEPINADSTSCAWTWESWADTVNIHCSITQETGRIYYNLWFRDHGEEQLPELLRIFKSGWDELPPYGDQFDGEEGTITIQDWYPDSLFSGYLSVEWDLWVPDEAFYFFTTWGHEFDGCFLDADCPYPDQCCMPNIHGDCSNEWGGDCYDCGGDVDYNCYHEDWLDSPPVCSCSGITYENGCVSVLWNWDLIAYNGECLEGNECYMGYDCPNDYWPGHDCLPNFGECGFNSGPGSCIEMDQDCTFEFNPVCGCDGVTYHNGCISGSWYGVGIQSNGLCQSRTTYHVSEAGSYTIADGSMEFPFPEIQYGIEVAVDGDTVLVHPGTYTENLNLQGKAILLTSSDGAEQTVIHGECETVITFNTDETSTTIVRGFTVTGGNSTDSGGALYFSPSTWPRLEDLIVSSNSSINAAPVFIDGGGPSFSRCLFDNNQSDAASVISAPGGSVEILNCTFTNNTSSNGHTIELSWFGSYIVVKNTIFWNNQDLGAVNNTWMGVDVEYSDTQWEVYSGEGNLSLDPEFLSPDEQDYRLGFSSPCIDAGDPEFPLDDDCSSIDMGAFPYDHCYFLMGDIIADLNGDGATDILDIVMMVNCILNSEDDEQDCLCADMNDDCIIDILDIVSLVNLILSP